MGQKNTDIKLQVLQDKDIILLLDKNVRGAIGVVMRGRYVKLDENRKIF